MRAGWQLCQSSRAYAPAPPAGARAMGAARQRRRASAALVAVALAIAALVALASGRLGAARARPTASQRRQAAAAAAAGGCGSELRPHCSDDVPDSERPLGGGSGGIARGSSGPDQSQRLLLGADGRSARLSRAAVAEAAAAFAVETILAKLGLLEDRAPDGSTDAFAAGAGRDGDPFAFAATQSEFAGGGLTRGRLVEMRHLAPLLSDADLEHVLRSFVKAQERRECAGARWWVDANDTAVTGAPNATSNVGARQCEFTGSVINAGLFKTGTTSTTAALKKLGYHCNIDTAELVRKVFEARTAAPGRDAASVLLERLAPHHVTERDRVAMTHWLQMNTEAVAYNGSIGEVPDKRTIAEAIKVPVQGSCGFWLGRDMRGYSRHLDMEDFWDLHELPNRLQALGLLPFVKLVAANARNFGDGPWLALYRELDGWLDGNARFVLTTRSSPTEAAASNIVMMRSIGNFDTTMRWRRNAKTGHGPYADGDAALHQLAMLEVEQDLNRTSTMKAQSATADSPRARLREEGFMLRDRRRYVTHVLEVLEYFAARPCRLLVLNYERAPSDRACWSQLAAHLGCPAVPAAPFPAQNTRKQRDRRSAGVHGRSLGRGDAARGAH